jgi:aspartate aminotransferase-like enzyme
VSGLLPHLDPDGLLEYSVVFTDRSLNHMSQAFQEVMRELSASLTRVYGAEALVLVPGGGSFAMEAVARQFGRGRRCLVVRNGWFSYRWSQILETGGLAAETVVLKAAPVEEGEEPGWAPAPLATVLEAIERHKPQVVFAPHVETSAGILLPDAYLKAVAEAVHAQGGLFVLDCVASGALWVDMAALGVDVLISAPQKGWTSTPCAGLVLLGARGIEALEASKSDSFALDLARWKQIMEAYLGGGHAYHATLPTDGLRQFRDTIRETEGLGFAWVRDRQVELGHRVRSLLAERGFRSVAAPGFEAPGVVVCHTTDEGLHKGARFAAAGVQIAAGVPLQCDEPPHFRTFRIGLFGLDKLTDVQGCVERLSEALDRMGVRGPQA